MCCLVPAVCPAAGPPPVITVQPADTEVDLGGIASLIVIATSGTTLTYQWYFNGSQISGETLSTLVRSPAQTTDGGVYSVAVRNAGGTVYSRNAVLTILNTAPFANKDSYSTPEHSTLTVPGPGVLANDSDANGDALSAVLVTNALHGTLQFFASGGFTYQPFTNFYGTDLFSYRAGDMHPLEQDLNGGWHVAVKQGQKGAQAFKHGVAGGPSYSIGKVLLYLSRGAQAPDANLKFSIGTGINSGALAGSTVLVSPSVITNTSSGASSQPYEICLFPPVGPLTAGTNYYLNLECEAPNGKEIDLEADWNATYASGTYYLAGSNSKTDLRFRVAEALFSAPTSVIVTVTPVNDPPIAVADTTNTLKNTSVVIHPLANDIDPDGDPLSLTGVSATNGIAVIVGQDILFTPALDFWGTTVLKYTVSDGTNSSIGTVTVDVIDTGFHLSQSLVDSYQGGTNYDAFVQAVVADAQGNVYVTGYSFEPASGSYDYVTLKYDTNGTRLWRVAYDGPPHKDDHARALAVDTAGNVYVTGANAKPDFATIKYDSAGNRLWTAVYDQAGAADQAVALAVDPAGNVLVTGYSVNTNGNYDFATVKYGPGGRTLWVQRYDGPANGDDFAVSLAVDCSGNVYVTGKSAGLGSGNDYATVKYAPDGTQLWVARYDGPASLNDEPVKVAVDSVGNCYVTGASQGQGTDYDYATLKYAPDGTQLWVQRFDGAASLADKAVDLAVDVDGNVLVSGSSALSPSNSAVVTLKYSTSGTPAWTQTYGSLIQGDSQAAALALDPAGDVCVALSTKNVLTGYDIGLLKYANHDGSLRWNASYNSTGAVNDQAVAVAVDRSFNIYVAGRGFSPLQYVLLKYTPNLLPPVAVTLAPTNITLETALLHGNVLSSGFSTVSYFEYGETTAYGRFTGTNEAAAVTNPLSLAAGIDGLAPQQIYHCRLVVSNFVGVTRGNDVAFMTAPYSLTAVPAGANLQLSMFSAPGVVFTVLTSPDADAPIANWAVLGTMVETSPGLYQFIDPNAATDPKRFYRLRTP